MSDDDIGSRLFDRVTDSDRRRWQIQAHAALATVLGRAAQARLAPLHWTLGPTGQLHGTVPTLGYAADKVAEIYVEWADFLGLSTRRTARGSHGTVHLTATGDIPGRTGRLGRPVVISADLHPAEDIDPTTEEC
ncbi:hypothetical protein [Amycolatopsis rifamycinica]|uniref:Uncharacterized protein n=1 Tax=Amycolatopsis rifamycinica TaxID=287986 RepID=A0A066UGF8_9PSEU|nr:hypothetical protein [Amycolatopsis rifamycinica]KDN23219.1 hypothetical protein DV20_05740 [Amycolatopsis rifamycinica]